MKFAFAMMALLAGSPSAYAQQINTTPVQAPIAASPTTEYFASDGHLIGSVTTIAGVTYFTGPDGSPLGTAERVGNTVVYRPH